MGWRLGVDDRPPAWQRLFVSPAVEAAILNLTARMVDPDLARTFTNCLPNTLDTTVRYAALDGSFYRSLRRQAELLSGQPTVALPLLVPPGANVSNYDSFVITGDIDASWLRDSTNQVAIPRAALFSRVASRDWMHRCCRTCSSSSRIPTCGR